MKPLDILLKSAKIDHELQREDSGCRINCIAKPHPHTVDGLNRLRYARCKEHDIGYRKIPRSLYEALAHLFEHRNDL